MYDEDGFEEVRKYLELEGWKSPEEMIEAIIKHMHCRERKEYHKINGNDATCLDIVIEDLGLSGMRQLEEARKSCMTCSAFDSTLEKTCLHVNKMPEEDVGCDDWTLNEDI